MAQTTELRAETAIEVGVGNTAVAIAVDSSNRVGVGTTSPVYRLHLHEPSSAPCFMTFTNTTTGTTDDDGLLVGIDSSENGYLWNQEDTVLLFGQNDMERCRMGPVDMRFNHNNDDYDWWVETTGLTYGIHVDAGNDAVGIGGAANASYVCAVTGSLRVSVDIDYVGDLNDISDAALKENVETMTDHIGALRDKFMALRPVRYTWKAQPFLDVGLQPPGGPTDFRYGFISQEVAAEFPEITTAMNLGNLLGPSDPQVGDDEYQETGGVRTGEIKTYNGLKKLELLAVNTAMVQWLTGHAETTRNQLDTAKTRVQTLEAQMAQAIARIQALENP